MKRFVVAGVAMMVAACRGNTESGTEVARAVVHCVPIASRPWVEQRVIRGTVSPRPDRDALLSAQVPGRLLRVLAREGDHVEAGAIVAEVESRPLRDSLRQAEAVLGQARAQRTAASASVLREQHLYERGISARQTLEAAQAALGQAEGAVALASAQVDVARQSLERAAVRTPIAGFVVRLLRREGEVVDGTPTTAIMQVADPSELELSASVRASDLVMLATGQTAEVTLEPLPGRRFEATVRTVSPAVDLATGVGTVRLSLQTTGANVPLGILGTAAVHVGHAITADVVPSSAIRSAGGTRTEVVLCINGHARPLPVVVGDRRDGVAQIVSGLESVARPALVALDGLTGLVDGTAIEEAR